MLTFADYMNRLLYGPAGYYSTGTAKSGKGGDYFTAPDVGSIFGQLLAEIFSSWKSKWNTDRFSLIEVGAGEGRLALDILKSKVFRYVAVERSPMRYSHLLTLKPHQPSLEVHQDLSELDGEGLEGVLFGNELIDAFPVHRVQWKNGNVRELVVDEAGEKPRFVWKLPTSPKLADYFERLGISLPDGYETEVNLAMAGWLKAAARVLKKGLVVLIDYGRPAHDYYAPERMRGTLRAFSKHKVSADFLDPSGMVDLTADVDFTSLALDGIEAGFTPLAYMEMGTFLMSALEAGFKPAEADRVRLKYLLHPEGMGAAFNVLILGKGLNASEWPFEHNRLKRLDLERKINPSV